MFEFRPILATLLRHKTAAALIVLEIALSCAIICNAVFLISQRVERIGMTSGIAENELVNVQLTGIGETENPQAMTTADLAALTAIPGVKSAAVSNQVPFNNSSWGNSVNLSPDQERPTLNATMYLGSPSLLETLGARLVQGRMFSPDEYIELDREEMYGEFFDIPAPDATIFVSWFTGGEVFRSGVTYVRGRGRIFYFRPGHETYPTYHDPRIQGIIANGVRWAAPTNGPTPVYGEREPVDAR